MTEKPGIVEEHNDWAGFFERIAFPALSDEQLAILKSLGMRRKFSRGEIIYKAGQRDIAFNLVLSRELEVFQPRDGGKQILATPGPPDFIGDIAMLTGTAVVATTPAPPDYGTSQGDHLRTVSFSREPAGV